MPRVTINKKKYKASDLSAYIVGELYRKKMSQSELAKEMFVSQQAINKKIREARYSYDDLLTIFEILNTPEEKIIEFMKVGR